VSDLAPARPEEPVRAPRPERLASRSRNEAIVAAFSYAVILLLAFAFVLPFAWQVSSALKPPEEIFALPIQWIPRHPGLQNFAEAWKANPLGRYTVNTARLTILSLVGHILVSSFIGYGFAKRRFPGREVLFMILLATMMVPFHVKAVPLYIIFKKLGWIDSLKPLVIPAYFGGDAVFIFLFRQFFRSIPNDLDEAAEIDGCNPLYIYWRIIFPLSKPVIATVAIFSFMGSWNELWGPLIYLNTREKYTLSIGLRYFLGEYTIEYHLFMAASLIAVIPCVAIFFVFQRYFVKGVVMSGLKG